jgi:hypothetical protein
MLPGPAGGRARSGPASCSALAGPHGCWLLTDTTSPVRYEA